MGLSKDRRLPNEAYAQLRAEVLRAAVELSEDQLFDLTDALHDVIRRRRRPDSRTTDEPRSFAN